MAHRVLIVDDSGFMRNIVKQILVVDEDLEVAGEAEDGQVALEREKDLKPEVVLLDIEMPKLDGLNVLKRLKLTSRAKVVILSSVAQLGSPAALEARRLGAFDVIAKPSGAISLDLKAKCGHEILKVVRAAIGLPPLDVAAMAKRAQARGN
ncbi:MAG TPA: response regulator [Methylovirgula sp.]|jgi:two-component system chemotaxis response regulator CheB